VNNILVTPITPCLQNNHTFSLL